MRILTQDEFSHYVDTKFLDFNPAVIWLFNRRYTFYVKKGDNYYRILILYLKDNSQAMIYYNNQRHPSYITSGSNLRYLLDNIYELLFCDANT